MPAKPIDKNKLIPVIPKDLRIKYKDVFELKMFYKAMRQWAKEYQWGALEGGEGYERYYKEVVSQGGAKEIRFNWRLYKPAPETPYLRYYLDIDYKMIGLKSKEVVKDGKKLKLDSGEIEMKFNAFLELDFLKDFEKDSLLKHFKELFQRRIYAKTINQREKELYQEVYGLLRFVKEWFKLRRFLPHEESESFFPSYTYPSHEK